MLALTMAAGAADARPRVAFLTLRPQVESVHLAFVDGLQLANSVCDRSQALASRSQHSSSHAPRLSCASR
jgi:hypothetical protein